MGDDHEFMRPRPRAPATQVVAAADQPAVRSRVLGVSHIDTEGPACSESQHARSHCWLVLNVYVLFLSIDFAGKKWSHLMEGRKEKKGQELDLGLGADGKWR